MRKWLSYILLCTVTLTGFAGTLSGQNQNNIWFFGNHAGVDFNPATPVALQTGFVLREGMTTVCDPATGSLLFSTNGASVWTKYHTLMPNGSGLYGNPDNTQQGVCVVPVIDTPGRYYLFSLEYQASRMEPVRLSHGRLFYSVVDLSLNGGLGDVVAARKNILLDSLLSESMIAVPGSNCDLWLISHAVDTPVFKAWHFTRSGFNTVPVVSYTGNQVYGPGSYNQSCLAASPDGQLLAITSRCVNALYPPYLAEGSILCQFDGGTGVVSNGILVDSFRAYSAAFSPDGRLLYVNNWHAPRELGIFQYDVTNYTQAAVSGSKMKIDTGGTSTYLRRFRDKIYTSQQLRRCLGSINNPNTRGAGCDYRDSVITLYPGTNTFYALPNDVVYPFPKDTLHTRTDTFLCATPQQLVLAATPGYDSYLWDDGSAAGMRQITQAGVYWVICGDYCHARVDTFVVTQRDSLFFTTDTVLCAGQQSLSLYAPPGYDGRQWDDLSTDSIRVVGRPGTYWVISADACVPRVDTFTVGAIDFSRFTLGADTVVCGDVPLTLAAAVAGADYLWQDGSTDSTYRVTGSGVYWVRAGKGSCRRSDTISVSYVTLPSGYLPGDTTICREDVLTLDIVIPAAATAIWRDGTAGMHYQAPDSGLYWVTVSLSDCRAADTMRLRYEACDCRFAVPSAFTPDGDGRNDYFRPVIEPACVVRNYRCYVLNRWGQVVYDGNDPRKGWDGQYLGEPAEVGTYMFVISFEGGKGRQYSGKGDLTLIR